MLTPEVIGPPDCPILRRWTLWPLGLRVGARGHRVRESKRQRKLLLHHFLPDADDRDVHDHPWPFWTFVFQGSYNDMRQCPNCHGDATWCHVCHETGVVLRERMRIGMCRYRPATHKHRTMVGPRGCWTLVFAGPYERHWGFWRGRTWWYYQDYEAKFGYAMRCDDLDREYRK